jgi:hypothetical protein
MFPRARTLALAAILLAPALLACGCTRKTTAPVPPVPLRRTVTVRLVDAQDLAVADQLVTLIGLSAGSGAAPTLNERTNAAGLATFTLLEGPWAAAVEPRVVGPFPGTRFVAGGTFTVPGVARAAADTVLVQLVQVAASTVSGTTTLAGETDHAGTRVSADACLYPSANTDALGRWTIGDVPPGTWNVVFTRTGFLSAVRAVTVPAPASAVTLPPVQLQRP